MPQSPTWQEQRSFALDRAKKLPIYAREGVEHAWILDADAQTLERLRLENGHWSLHGVHAGNDVVRAEPFGEIDLELRLLWAWPADPGAAFDFAQAGKDPGPHEPGVHGLRPPGR